LQKTSKVRTFIGFAIKAGDVVYGMDGITAHKRPPELIVVMNTGTPSSERALKNLRIFAERYGVRTIAANEPLAGRPGCKMLGVYNKSLANAVFEALAGETDYVEINNKRS
jgi:hypothetical protein